jgi:hypothetical protein
MCVFRLGHTHDIYQPKTTERVDIMRIVWKDSMRCKTYQYRGCTISRFENGWITDIPNDENIYYSADMAHNAVDQILGGTGQKGQATRHRFGVKVIGKKPERGDVSCV